MFQVWELFHLDFWQIASSLPGKWFLHTWFWPLRTVVTCMWEDTNQGKLQLRSCFIPGRNWGSCEEQWKAQQICPREWPKERAVVLDWCSRDCSCMQPAYRFPASRGNALKYLKVECLVILHVLHFCHGLPQFRILFFPAFSLHPLVQVQMRGIAVPFNLQLQD